MDYPRAIRDESERFYGIAEGADPTLGVPSCPGWSIADLVWHLGEVHWFWATDVERRAASPDEVEALKPPRPDSYEELLSFGRDQLEHLLAALASTPDDVAVWTWALGDADHNVAFVRRHQVQEAAVHRWDLQSAATTADPDPIDPVVASDSVDELLHVSLPWVVSHERPLSGSVHLHCTDTEGEWLVHPGGRVERGHLKGDVAIRGTASDLLLALYARVSIDTLDLVGNAAVARQLVERLDTT
jgi:uncharacterized protein (TIGR03083 family)